MATQKQGKHSFVPAHPVIITHWASIAGKRESEGPLGKCFDLTDTDTKFGQKTWEQAERQMQKLALDTLCKKAGLRTNKLDLIFSGDLLNQCIGSSFTVRNSGIPHLGLYGACSTMAESLLLGTMAVGGGYADRVVAMTSSHFASSERQYRFPLGYGGQRTPTAQWTVTGSGAVLLSGSGVGPHITGCTVGTVTDLGVKDANNMGAAMAPAAFQTILQHFEDFHTGPETFDCIVTGDLGQIGKALLTELFSNAGVTMGGRLEDCGCMLFDNTAQDVHAGGSGCGCSAVVLCAKLLELLNTGKYKNLLFCGTGALLSPTSTQQGLPIPGVCHAVAISGRS